MDKKLLGHKSRFTIYYLLFTFLFWRFSLFLARWLGRRFIPLREEFLGGEGLSVWANFDGVHYLNIAKNGYVNFEQTFFPLYPILTRFLAPIFRGNFLFSALFISHICFLTTLFLFFKLLNLDFKDRSAIIRNSLFIILCFPTSFFFVSVYTESLFLMLVLGAFLAAKKERWWLAGILGALASATRLVGIFLLPAFFIEWREQKVNNKQLTINNLQPLGICLVPLGLLSYMLFLYQAFDDPLMFLHAQSAVGYRETGRIILLPQVFWRYFKIFLTVSPRVFTFWIAIFELGITLLFLFLSFFSFSKSFLSYSVFMLLSILTPTLTGTLNSMPRYVLTCFPGFILLGMVKSKRLFFVLCFLFFVLCFLATALFTRGYFIS